MNSDEVVHLQELTKAYLDRLRALQLQAARYGNDCPAHITVEISTTEKQLSTLEQQIGDGLHESYPKTKVILEDLRYHLDSIQAKLQTVQVQEKEFRLFGRTIFSIVTRTT